MKYIAVLIFTVLFALAVSNVYAVESCTLTQSTKTTYSGNKLILYTWTWVSAADGSASCTGINIYGRLAKIITDPGATAPTDNYDIVLNEDGVDVTGGSLQNRDTANTEQTVPVLGTEPIDCYVAGSVSAEVTNAGDTKGGEITLYVIP